MAQTDQQIVRVGTRDSVLARLQTDIIIARLSANFPGLVCEIVPVTTHGDKVLDRPIAELGTRGVFVKELEQSLLSNEVDLVVHSLKDLPTDLPSGLKLAAVLDREDPRDVLVSHNQLSLEQLPEGSRIATSSRRRAAQLKHIRSDFEFVDVRGNISTRLQKHDEGLCHAIVLAAAGLLRLGLTDRISQYLDPSISMPAAGQGALAVECRAAEERILELCRAIDHPATNAQVTAERAFLDELGGGCSVPIGALCVSGVDGSLLLSACVVSLDGAELMRASRKGSPAEAEQIGRGLAGQMLADGADRILQTLKTSAPNPVSAP